MVGKQLDGPGQRRSFAADETGQVRQPVILGRKLVTLGSLTGFVTALSISRLPPKLSQAEQSLRHRRGVRGGIAQAGNHVLESEATIEAIAELRQVARKVAGADMVIGAVPCRAVPGRLDVADEGVDPGAGLQAHAVGTAAGDDGLVLAPCLREGGETAQPIGRGEAAGAQVARALALGHRRTKGTECAHAQAQRMPRVAERDRRHTGRLAWRPAPALAATVLTVPVDVVELDLSGQGLGSSRSFVTCSSVCFRRQAALSPSPSSSAEVPFLGWVSRYIPQEPGRQGQLAVRKERAADQRRLVTAAPALIKMLASQFPAAPMATDRADKAGGPAPGKHDAVALLFAAVLSEKPGQTQQPALKLDRILPRHDSPHVAMPPHQHGPRTTPRLSFEGNQEAFWATRWPNTFQKRADRKRARPATDPKLVTGRIAPSTVTDCWRQSARARPRTTPCLRFSGDRSARVCSHEQARFCRADMARLTPNSHSGRPEGIGQGAAAARRSDPGHVVGHFGISPPWRRFRYSLSRRCRPVWMVLIDHSASIVGRLPPLIRSRVFACNPAKTCRFQVVSFVVLI
jgi:hypothetical protein